MYKRKSVFLVVVMILTILLVRSPAPTHAQGATFIISSWDYPDEYGQGIPYIVVQNGSQVLDTLEWDESSTMEGIEIDTNLTLGVFVWLNGTEAGISSTEEGYALIQHRVIVSTPLNSSVFSQQNFTFIIDTGEANAPMYFYRYDVILDFTPIAGQIYTVTVTYEIYYDGETVMLPMVYASAGDSGSDDEPAVSSSGAYTDTAAVDGTNYVFLEDDSAISYIYLNVTVPEYTQIEGFNYSTFAYGQYLASGGGVYDNFQIYDFNNTIWVDIGNLSADTLGWTNGTITNSDYWDDVVMIWYDFQIQEFIDGNGGEVDYLGLEFFRDNSSWYDIGEADLIFPIGWDPTFQFGYDAFFIFLGLIMIPASTMYLVKGGRKEFSSTKLFSFLIIFMVGFGLLVGGIMP